ncbi:uncharacterized protein LOC132796122 isoform X1 [Drosophila nasuta]|uniref:Uncharacterized protein LOC117577568 n=1 Tax=Drosophila albomicans TaxID=7291 RepID=A0A6P8XNX8_DROAB|nr:uncharacterized protein LOC117577568 [Drosophila albomicans]XP_060663155.1 uncharacterized protein LOC132796122 isoform X1 [Drosophila nasuta]XP_060663156.1 uncharacterized protein LOC132796122 isoform X1 [Drosophila nasuta]
MEVKQLKRMRSEDEECNNNVTQTKVWVNEKILESRDPDKMKAVHEKTTKMLFKAAADLKATKAGTTNGTQSMPSERRQLQPYEQYQLIGDGNLILRDLNPDAVNPELVRHMSKCCRRPTFIRAACANCTFDLCEECGYSCVECQKFICRTCVTLFGNRPEEAERPLCERCQMFF